MWGFTKNRVNNIIFVPSFPLPTNATLCQKVVNVYHMEDFDIRENFHNYSLRLCESSFHGVLIASDIVKIMKEAEPLMRWKRIPFGWYQSPVFSLSVLARAILLVKIHSSDSTSSFQWSSVILNPPVSPDYNPSKPCVQIIRHYGCIAVGCIAFFIMVLFMLQTMSYLRRAFAKCVPLFNG